MTNINVSPGLGISPADFNAINKYAMRAASNPVPVPTGYDLIHEPFAMNRTLYLFSS